MPIVHQISCNYLLRLTTQHAYTRPWLRCMHINHARVALIHTPEPGSGVCTPTPANHPRSQQMKISSGNRIDGARGRSLASIVFVNERSSIVLSDFDVMNQAKLLVFCICDSHATHHFSSYLTTFPWKNVPAEPFAILSEGLQSAQSPPTLFPHRLSLIDRIHLLGFIRAWVALLAVYERMARRAERHEVLHRINVPTLGHLVRDGLLVVNMDDPRDAVLRRRVETADLANGPVMLQTRADDRGLRSRDRRVYTVVQWASYQAGAGRDEPRLIQRKPRADGSLGDTKNVSVPTCDNKQRHYQNRTAV